ncbi:kinase-like protein [Ceratobasidium sp. AG-I]|nr:kinase-like protein [Ceratobasidium sp. AG-I]
MDSDSQRERRELHTWSKCDHPGVLPLLRMAMFQGRIAMVSPLMSNGRLDRRIAHNPFIDRIELSIQIAEALAYLHEKGIIHGHVKAANILVSKDCQIKVADFGNAVASPRALEITPMSSSCSMRWAAPEILDTSDVENTLPADLYALGITILVSGCITSPYSLYSYHITVA